MPIVSDSIGIMKSAFLYLCMSVFMYASLPHNFGNVELVRPGPLWFFPAPAPVGATGCPAPVGATAAVTRTRAKNSGTSERATESADFGCSARGLADKHIRVFL